ncbi:hypothetical protein QQ045_017131 [Rhodiola kirilowii]
MAVQVFISFLILCVLAHGDCRQSSVISEEQEYQIEIEKRLQILNKPPVKTIITKETGDFFDCIPINEQPAFDHPTLKNHKVKLPPASPIFTNPPNKGRKTSVKLRGTREACPDGTVPIKRTTKEDLIQSDKELIAMKDQEAASKKANLKLEGKLHGSFSYMALYNLTIANDQESSSEVRFEAGPPGQTDALSLGWKVSHSLNGDGFTRLFGYWHDGTNNKGCYNTLCPGFVQVDKEIPINYLFPPPLSVYGDVDQQYNVFLASYAVNATNGDWYLYAGNHPVVNIGYWPKELFPNLKNGAERITWGGATSPGKNGVDYPPMGNGHIPDGQYEDTCFFNGIRYVNSADEIKVPTLADVTIYIDSPDTPVCYDLNVTQPAHPEDIHGFSFMFGGPGGIPLVTLTLFVHSSMIDTLNAAADEMLLSMAHGSAIDDHALVKEAKGGHELGRSTMMENANESDSAPTKSKRNQKKGKEAQLPEFKGGTKNLVDKAKEQNIRSEEWSLTSKNRVILHKHLLRTIAAGIVEVLLVDLVKHKKQKNGIEVVETSDLEIAPLDPGDRISIVCCIVYSS